MCGATISIRAGARCNRKRKYLYTDAIYRQSAGTPPRNFCRLQGKYYNYVVGATTKAYIIYCCTVYYIISYVLCALWYAYIASCIREFFDCHLSTPRSIYYVGREIVNHTTRIIDDQHLQFSIVSPRRRFPETTIRMQSLSTERHRRGMKRIS